MASTASATNSHTTEYISTLSRLLVDVLGLPEGLFNPDGSPDF